MDEAKSIAVILLSVIISISVLGVTASLITYANETWGTVQRQEMNNKAMSDYAIYAAFDNTEVRGSDIISLIDKTRGYPFIAVFTNISDTSVEDDANPERAPGDFRCGYSSSGTRVKLFIDPDTFKGFNFEDFDSPGMVLEHNIKQGTSFYYDKASGKSYVLNGFKNIIKKGDVELFGDTAGKIKRSTLVLAKDISELKNSNGSAVYNSSTINKDDFKELQKYFLERGKFQYCTEEYNSTVFEGYTRYLAQLVYESKESTEVVGITFMELQGMGDFKED